MTLRMARGRTAISVDSNINDFDAIAARAARAVIDHRAAADDITLANLAALGLPTPAQSLRPGTAEPQQ